MLDNIMFTVYHVKGDVHVVLVLEPHKYTPLTNQPYLHRGLRAFLQTSTFISQNVFMN